MADQDADRRQFLSLMALGSLISAFGSRAVAAPGEESARRPGDHFPGVPSAADPNNGLSPARIPYPPCDEKLKAEIDAVLVRTEQIWNRQEWWRLPTEIWDREDETPIYVAEELFDVMVGWDILDKYIFPPKKGLDAFRWGYSHLWVKELAPGVALALYDHWFEIKIKVPGPVGVPRAGFDRVLSIYNRRADGWRQSLYAQCPLGPDTYVRAMVEKLVQPDFREWYEGIKKNPPRDPRL
jgi:hypothetical protein